MKTITRLVMSALVGIIISSTGADAVQIASNFTITNRKTGQPIKRDDFAGKILFLDFFAYWCGPCRASSPSVEKEIAKYYAERGGNPDGVEVVVIGVNIEDQSPDQTDAFIKSVGFEIVANDYGASTGAWAQFGQGGIPHFVVMNGVQGGSHQQWEVLHSDAGFKGSAFYRNLIDSIKKPRDQRVPEITVEQPANNKLKDGRAKINFGTRNVGAKGITKTFIIRNDGRLPLTSIKVKISGADSKNFILQAPRTSTLHPGVGVAFKVRFSPVSKGVKKSTLQILSNDANEATFDIKLTGAGILE